MREIFEKIEGKTFIERIDRRVEEIIRFKRIGERRSNDPKAWRTLMDGIDSVLFAPADSDRAVEFVICINMMYDENEDFYFIREKTAVEAYIGFAHAELALDMTKKEKESDSSLTKEQIKELRKYTVLKVKLEEQKYKLKQMELKRTKII